MWSSHCCLLCELFANYLFQFLGIAHNVRMIHQRYVLSFKDFISSVNLHISQVQYMLALVENKSAKFFLRDLF